MFRPITRVVFIGLALCDPIFDFYDLGFQDCMYCSVRLSLAV
jgi:hypothetical protein